MNELLTEQEQELVKLLGDCYNLFTKVCGNDSKVRVFDLQEFALHIHNCQNTVLAQAAARAYPDLYRLAGENPWVAEKKVEETNDD